MDMESTTEHMMQTHNTPLEQSQFVLSACGVGATVHLGALQEVLHQLHSRASSHMLSPLDCIVPSREERQSNQRVGSSSSNVKHLLDPCQLHLRDLRVLGIPTLQVRTAHTLLQKPWRTVQASMRVVGTGGLLRV